MNLQDLSGLTDSLCTHLHGDEVVLISVEAEESEFARLNRARLRQGGHVHQVLVRLELIRGARHVSLSCDATGVPDTDRARLAAAVDTLRGHLDHVPEDPYLNYCTRPRTHEHTEAASLPAAETIMEQIRRDAPDMDLVGIWARGAIHHGFASSLGHRLWSSRDSFHFDWSCYLPSERGVKRTYAGFAFDPLYLERDLEQCRVELARLQQPARELSPGVYRAYLAPQAVRELLDMMSWGGFGLRSQRTAQSPLLHLARGERSLHASVRLLEQPTAGAAAPFTAEGFARPESVTLIDRGESRDLLADARSAREYGVAVNSPGEFPDSLTLDPGSLEGQSILEALDEGLYINNLWYLNFSDRNQCRMTGMTRYACYWVEHGRIQAPVNAMRFDDSIYSLLGTALIDLTSSTHTLFDAASYEARSTRSYRVPGILVSGLTLTL